MIIGIDGGNSYIKVVYDKPDSASLAEPAELIIPTVYKKYEESRSNELLKNNSSRYKPKEAIDISVTVHIEDQKRQKYLGRYLIGLSAIYNGGQGRVIGTTKYNDPDMFVAMLGSCAYAIYDVHQHQPEMQNINENVTVGLCLPYAEATKEGAQTLRENWIGTHSVKFNDPIFCGLEVTIIVDNVDIDVEGAVAMVEYIYRPDGQYALDPQQMVNQRICLIEVGSFTTENITQRFVPRINTDDIFAQSDEIELVYDQSLCWGLQKGISTAQLMTIHDIENRYPIMKDRLKITDIESAMRQSRGILPGGIDISEFYKNRLREVAQSIAREFHSRVSDVTITGDNGLLPTSIYKVIISGGGAIAMGDMISEYLKQLGYKTEIMKKPLWANAYGCYKNAYTIAGDIDNAWK